eukprot:3161858-Pyramimonas_sp.AAC.1
MIMLEPYRAADGTIAEEMRRRVPDSSRPRAGSGAVRLRAAPEHCQMHREWQGGDRGLAEGGERQREGHGMEPPHMQV